jgi:type II secretory pathway pseudopilin PulG
MDRMMHLIGKQVLLLAAALVVTAPSLTAQVEQQKPARANREDAAAVIGQYLAIGSDGKQLPADFVVTIETSGSPTKESGVTNDVFQAWRFTGNTVSRLDPNEKVVSTFAFQDIQAVCRMLRDGDIVGLSAAPRGKGTQDITLLGTPCSFGFESIKVTVGGNVLAVHGQSCWVANFADPKDQQRFDRLYARLRAMAMEAEVVRWGQEVNGLQMGISAGWDITGAVKPLFDGTNIVFGVD